MSFYSDSDYPMNSYGQASYPGEANPVSYLTIHSVVTYTEQYTQTILTGLS